MPIKQEDFYALALAGKRHADALNDLIVTVQQALARLASDETYTPHDAVNAISAMLPVVIPSPASTALLATAIQHYKKNYKKNKYNAERMARKRRGEAMPSEAELVALRQLALGSEGSDDETEAEGPQAELPAESFVPFNARQSRVQLTPAEEAELARQLAEDEAERAAVEREMAEHFALQGSKRSGP